MRCFGSLYVLVFDSLHEWDGNEMKVAYFKSAFPEFLAPSDRHKGVVRKVVVHVYSQEVYQTNFILEDNTNLVFVNVFVLSHLRLFSGGFTFLWLRIHYKLVTISRFYS